MMKTLKQLLSRSSPGDLEAFLHKYRWLLGGAGVLTLLVFPVFGFSHYIMRILILIAVYTILALGLNILTGYTGMLSLGHAGFYAIGAYTCALLMLRLEWSFFAALPAAAAFTGLCGLFLGFPTLRLTGTYLSIVTLGFCEMVRMVIMNWDPVTNGTLGLRGIPVPVLFGRSLTLSNNGLYYLALVLLSLVTAVCITVVRSKIGRAFRAIKADELTATMMGIPTTRYKILSFVLSASISGLAGGFYASLIGYIDHNSFTFDVSILIVSIVILGGMGTISGMYLGAAILIIFPEVARPLMEWRFVIYGLVLVLMMRFRPQGLLGRQSQSSYRFPNPGRSQNKQLAPDPLEEADGGTQRTSPIPSESPPQTGGRVRGMSLLEVQDLTISFGGLTAVDHVSFSVNRGEIISIIGPNGAGKTTIFNILTGAYQVDEGRVLFRGEAIQDRKPQDIVQAGIARTFQNIRLFPDMRVIENVLVGTHINTGYGLFDAVFRTGRYRREEWEKNQKAAGILASIGLGGKVSDYAQNLPYGAQRRLEIARAMATGAQLLLLDEPAAGMNPQESEELLKFIRQLRDAGSTILLIEHDMSVVMNISDRIYVIDYGKKIAEGLPADISNNERVIEAYLGGARKHA